jgi:hypothetical protein
LSSGFYQFGPIQQFRYKTLLVKDCHAIFVKAYRYGSLMGGVRT